MARPEKQTADYFPFYVKDGRTLTVLQHKHGLAGIGFFTNLMRILTSTPKHYINLNDDSDIVYFSARIGCDDSEVETYLETMFQTRKLSRQLWDEYHVLFCQDLVDTLQTLYDKRVSNPATVSDIINEVSVAETVVSGNKGEERKEEKRREDLGDSGIHHIQEWRENHR